MTNISRFIGRRAKPCNRCSGENHFVNKLGGIQCEVCSPPKSDSDVIVRLRIDGGFWQDQTVERFDFVDVPPPVAVKPTRSAPSEETKVSSLSYVPPNAKPFVDPMDRDTDLFLTDEIWGNPDQWIVRKANPRSPPSAALPRHKKGGASKQTSSIDELFLPEVGDSFQLDRRIETFGGFIQPGEYTISAVYRDGFGYVCVDLSRRNSDGRTLVNGLAWPICG